MRSEHIEQLVRLYRLAVKMAWVTVGLSLLAILFQTCSAWLPDFICSPLGGGPLFVPYLTLPTALIAVFKLRWALKTANSLTELRAHSEDQALASYQRLWNFQTNAGALVTTGAVIMIPLTIPALIMGLAGGTAVFALFGGAWLHMRARKINREIAFPQLVSMVNGEVPGLNTTSNTAQIEPQGGLVPLVAGACLLALNVIIEIILTNDLRGIPTFYGTPSTTNAGVSMTMGLSTFLDILAFSTIGLSMLIYAIVIRNRISKRRLWAIVCVTLAQLIFVQAQIAPVLARGLGPNELGAQLVRQMDASARTMAWIQAQDLPEGFEGAEPNEYQEEVNARWSAQSSPFNEDSLEYMCESVISYAIELGATDWADRYSKTTGAVADPTETKEGCLSALNGYPKLKVQRHAVASPEFILAGTSIGGSGSPFAVQLTLLKQGSLGDSPNAWIYELMIHTTYNEDPLTFSGGLAQGDIEINDLLTLIAQERLANPDRNPTDPVFLREILQTYQHPLDIQVIESTPGVANRLDLTNSDGLRICLAIDPWDEAEQGIEDPGYGYGFGFMQDLKALRGFGNAVEGGCK